jgi:hypothetical protein
MHELAFSIEGRYWEFQHSIPCIYSAQVCSHEEVTYNHMRLQYIDLPSQGRVFPQLRYVLWKGLYTVGIQRL